MRHMIIVRDLQVLRLRTCKLSLILCWILGLLFGSYAATGAGDYFFLMMRGDVFAVSIPGLPITSLPFLLTAIAVCMPHPVLLMPVILWKAFTFSYCACGLGSAFGGASWLLRFLMMFGQVSSVPALMWLWLRKCDGKNPISIGEIVLCGAIVALLDGVDRCVVMPFLASIL